jgi:ABC-type antimicrobial peptide transport system permease subunit
MSDGDPLVRGALEVRVGRGGTRVGRVQVTEAPARPGATARRTREPSRAPSAADPPRDGGIWLNEWTADDLDAHLGDTVHLDYFVWTDEGGLETRSASFALQGILPMMRIGGDRTLTPDYPGITDAPDLTAWDPPFPVDLSKVRPKDEAYWDQWRAAPKAFVPLEVGQRLWGSRFGTVSSIRFALRDVDAVTAAVRAGMSSQVVARLVRAEALAAAEGTTDFGEYFLYFSAFLVISALLLAGLFFRLGVEQRLREVGLLRAVGFTPRRLLALFLGEGAVLALFGAALGTVLAMGYAAAIMHGLRTWWVDAVGTTALALHVEPLALASGVVGAAAAALAALWMGTRALARRSPRSLLLGASPEASPSSARRSLMGGLTGLLAAAGLVAATAGGLLGTTPGFFGAGGAVLVGGLLLARAFLGQPPARGAGARGLRHVWTLGQSHTRWRPTRAVLTLSLIAFATFVLVSVVAFRRDASGTSLDRSSGTGGFALMAESAVPLMHDPDTTAGRDALGLDPSIAELEYMAVTRLRLRPGDEASCLTLYQPRNPRIVGVDPARMAGRFSFASVAATAADSPWSLLDEEREDGTIPAMADQTTLTYVFHLGVGDTFQFAPDGLSPVTFRIVAALADSVLQSELIIGEQNFVRLFPRHEGYRVWLIETPEPTAAAVAAMLEDRLADSGVDVVDTRERLAAYHRVENTYLATFQALGALGLLLGTLGVGAVLARNVLERQREWGLLRAVGYQASHLSVMVVAESAALVVGGVLLGAVAAALAIAPAIAERGQVLPLVELGGVMAAVVVAGLLSSLVALGVATRVPVVSAIKNE